MKNRSKTALILKMAGKCARQMPDFLSSQGPGQGNKITNAFMGKLHSRVKRDHQIKTEKGIFEKSKSKVDFYIPREGTIVEVALSLRNPLSGFYKDLFKALIMKNSYKVEKLVFLSKHGGERKILCNRLAMVARDWVRRNHKIAIEVKDI